MQTRRCLSVGIGQKTRTTGRNLSELDIAGAHLLQIIGKFGRGDASAEYDTAVPALSTASPMLKPVTIPDRPYFPSGRVICLYCWKWRTDIFIKLVTRREKQIDNQAGSLKIVRRVATNHPVSTRKKYSTNIFLRRQMLSAQDDTTANYDGAEAPPHTTNYTLFSLAIC